MLLEVYNKQLQEKNMDLQEENKTLRVKVSKDLSKPQGKNKIQNATVRVKAKRSNTSLIQDGKKNKIHNTETQMKGMKTR